MLYKCKNCGGELHFDPSLGKLKCDYCDAVYDLSDYQNDIQDEDQDAHLEGYHDHIHQEKTTAGYSDGLNETSFEGEYSDKSLHEDRHHHDHSHAGAAVQSAETLESYAGEQALEKGFDQATDDTTDVAEDLRYYQCPHCGAEVVTDKSTTATSCVFCNTPLILQENMQGTFRPASLIPFEIDRKQVGELYEKYIAKKPFYPDEYSLSNVIEKVKAVYLPFWLFDTHTSGSLEATGERTMTHTMGDWIITEHDVFSLQRAGEMDFFRIPVIASRKTPRDAMDSIEPYDYSRLVEFNAGYLPGFLAERYDLSSDQLRDVIHERARQTFDQRLTSTLSGFSSVRMVDGHMHHNDLMTTYVLLPAYILFMDYDRDEDALIAINGQTGRIAGNIPVDKKKMWRYAITRFVLLFVIIELIVLALICLL